MIQSPCPFLIIEQRHAELFLVRIYYRLILFDIFHRQPEKDIHLQLYKKTRPEATLKPLLVFVIIFLDVNFAKVVNGIRARAVNINLARFITSYFIVLLYLHVLYYNVYCLCR